MKVQFNGYGFEIYEMEFGFYKLGCSILLEFFILVVFELLVMNEVIVENFFFKEVINYDQEGEFCWVIVVFIFFEGIDSYELMN